MFQTVQRFAGQFAVAHELPRKLLLEPTKLFTFQLVVVGPFDDLVGLGGPVIYSTRSALYPAAAPSCPSCIQLRHCESSLNIRGESSDPIQVPRHNLLDELLGPRSRGWGARVRPREPTEELVFELGVVPLPRDQRPLHLPACPAPQAGRTSKPAIPVGEQDLLRRAAAGTHKATMNSPSSAREIGKKNARRRGLLPGST
jgi:hypothetical protein